MVALVAVAVGSLAATANGKRNAKSIEVLSLWGGSEQAAFLKVTAAFTKATGIDVKYTSARNFIPDIRTRLAAGDPPDIGILHRNARKPRRPQDAVQPRPVKRVHEAELRARLVEAR